MLVITNTYQIKNGVRKLGMFKQTNCGVLITYGITILRLVNSYKYKNIHEYTYNV
jgi:hypothetical protein